MRVVGGRLRSRPIAGPKSDALRPTADRLRESLFNILIHAYGDPVTGARVLDLFAGTGALGIEAISRGAAYALFVDDGVQARALLRDNTETLGLGGVTRIFRRDATKLGPAHPLEPFTLAFLDPPYRKGLAEKALAAARDGGWLDARRAGRGRGSGGRRLQGAGGIRGTGAARLRRLRSCIFALALERDVTVTLRETPPEQPLDIGRASTPHKSAGRGCTGRNWARLPSRAAARSSLPA